MVNEQQKKIAYAEGYHAGMLHEEFDNPYEDFDLRVQFNYGFRTATDRIDSLVSNNVKEYA
ncbi:hypothetical protein UFOVP230_54 [uncultured Caudovirales phage]|uniref:Uncharacterized protein n=1 Tax=uncultured Caudovirales phage TaxID=2100421 RepID=A0A6J7XRH4_9CAUD|nr:hypothetical protein UFOVP230_54 [uncultured Caudovirales phage]